MRPQLIGTRQAQGTCFPTTNEESTPARLLDGKQKGLKPDDLQILSSKYNMAYKRGGEVLRFRGRNRSLYRYTYTYIHTYIYNIYIYIYMEMYRKVDRYACMYPFVMHADIYTHIYTNQHSFSQLEACPKGGRRAADRSAWPKGCVASLHGESYMPVAQDSPK